MSDKRRRYRKPKEEKPQQMRIVRRQNDTETPKSSESEIQPKILLKPRTTEKELKEDDSGDANSTAETGQVPQRTIIASRSEASGSQVSTITKELPQLESDHTVPMMTRPATILSSTGVISTNAKKLLKDNTDFFVVGVIGTQGVGKSTILNLLANDDCDYYQKIFLDEDGYFPTKLKQHKCPSRSRTESTHMFIKNNMIFLDCAPVLCNSYKKDMTTNELDDLRSIVNFLSVCHLVIVVYTDYLNMNFMRLLRLAELMKPSQNGATSIDDYYPNLLFVKNRAKRRDFSLAEQKQMNDMLRAFFCDSKMNIHRGQHNEQQQLVRSRVDSTKDSELSINSFVFPEVKGLDAVPYHKPLNAIIEDLRWLVFTTPRNEMSSNSAEFTEIAWFELFEKVTQTTQHFFFNTYDEIHRNHFASVASGTNLHNANGNTRETQDNWKN